MATMAFGKAGSFLTKVSRHLSKRRPECLLSCRSYYDYSHEPFHPIANKKPEWKSADDAVSVIASSKWWQTQYIVECNFSISKSRIDLLQWFQMSI